MLFIMFNDFENFIVIKGNDKEEYAKDAVTGKKGPWTERPSDRQFAEGSFGTGYLKPIQHVYRAKATIVVNLRIVALREQTICLLYGG